MAIIGTFDHLITVAQMELQHGAAMAGIEAQRQTLSAGAQELQRSRVAAAKFYESRGMEEEASLIPRDLRSAWNTVRAASLLRPVLESEALRIADLRQTELDVQNAGFFGVGNLRDVVLPDEGSMSEAVVLPPETGETGALGPLQMRSVVPRQLAGSGAPLGDGRVVPRSSGTGTLVISGETLQIPLPRRST